MMTSSRLHTGAKTLLAGLALAAIAAAPASAAALSSSPVAFTLSPVGSVGSVTLPRHPRWRAPRRGTRPQPFETAHHRDPATCRYRDRQQRRRGLSHRPALSRRAMVAPAQRERPVGAGRDTPNRLHRAHPRAGRPAARTTPGSSRPTPPTSSPESRTTNRSDQPSLSTASAAKLCRSPSTSAGGSRGACRCDRYS